MNLGDVHLHVDIRELGEYDVDIEWYVISGAEVKTHKTEIKIRDSITGADPYVLIQDLLQDVIRRLS